MDLTKAYSAFVRAIEMGSFSAVATEMGVSASAISKTIAALEDSVGMQLFIRTTRKLHPTDEALQLYEQVRQLLDTMDSLRSTGRDRQSATPTGVLKIGMPHCYGRRRVLPRIPKFLQKYPEIKLDIVLSNDEPDLVESGLELGIRIGNLPSSTLIARSIGIIELSVVASPAYLKTRGQPDAPTDLAEHECIVSGAGNRWVFESELGRQTVDIDGALRIDDADAAYDAVVSGLGVALVPDWLATRDIARGRVVNLLPDFFPIPQPVAITYTQTRFLSPRARCFIDFIVEEMRRT